MLKTMDDVKVPAHSMNTIFQFYSGTIQSLKIYFHEPGMEFWIPTMVPPYKIPMIELDNFLNFTSFDIHLKKRIFKRLESKGSCKVSNSPLAKA